jgi:dethiobiotin synthetase
MTKNFSCFVTGTDTGVGKTLITAALLHALAKTGLRVTGMKPIAAGAELIDGELWNEDVAMLAAASNTNLPRELTTPYLLREPAAPHIAAQLEHVSLDMQHLLDCYQQIAQQSDCVIVEGVGGFCVPINDDVDTADLAVQLGLDVVMVVGLRLGCINHALLTAEAIKARGLNLVGWVANQIDVSMSHQQSNLQALEQRLSAPLIGVVPWMAAVSAQVAADKIDVSRIKNWQS